MGVNIVNAVTSVLSVCLFLMVIATHCAILCQLKPLKQYYIGLSSNSCVCYCSKINQINRSNVALVSSTT